MGGIPSMLWGEADDDVRNFPTIVVEEKRDERTIRPLIHGFKQSSKLFKFDIHDSVEMSSNEVHLLKNYGIFPLNVIHEIFLLCNLTEIYNMMTVCRLFHVVCDNQYFWKSYFKNYFSSRSSDYTEYFTDEQVEKDTEGVVNWKKEFFNRSGFNLSDSFYRRKYKKSPITVSYTDFENNTEISRRTEVMKIVTLGDHGAGRSSFVLRFVRDMFNENMGSTIGAAFLVKTMEYIAMDHEKSYAKLEMWDTSSEERFTTLAPMYYRGATGSIVFFGIDSLQQFERAKKWCEEVDRGSDSLGRRIFIVLVGSKTDLGERNRKVHYEQHIRPFIEDKEDFLKYVECSSKDNKNIFKVIGPVLDWALTRK